MHYDEPPLRFLGQVAHVTVKAVDRKMADHVAKYHAVSQPCPLALPTRPTLKAIPFRDRSIPGPELERMKERLETEPEADLYQVAADFGYPISLVERELADHNHNWRGWLRERAG